MKSLPFVILAALVYVALSPLVAMPVYNTMIFQPDFDGNFYPSRIDNCSVEPLWFSSNRGHRIFAWFVHNPHASKTVLLSHGNSGDLSDRAELIAKLTRAGASVFAYDYEGFGLTPGHPSVDRICDDGVSAYDYLVRQRHVPAKDIILFGESLGTGVTTHIASLRTSDGVILQSPFTSLLNVAREHLNLMYLYPDALFPRERLDELRVLEGKHPRVLMVHGAKDPLIPLKHALTLFANATAPKQLVVLPDAQHEDMPSTDSAAYDKALRAFIHAS
ncbi:MAG TPA: alpha/beta hydrolase [Candidatus Obscuribacterales bacterium]